MKIVIISGEQVREFFEAFSIFLQMADMDVPVHTAEVEELAREMLEGYMSGVDSASELHNSMGAATESLFQYMRRREHTAALFEHDYSSILVRRLSPKTLALELEL